MILCPLSTVARDLHLPSDPETLRDIALGVAVRFMESRYGGQLGPHLDRLVGAIESGQYRIFFDSYARPLAYCSWARVQPRQSALLLKHGPEVMNGSSWSSGPHAWVIDLFAHEGSLSAVMDHLRDVVFAQDNGKRGQVLPFAPHHH